MAWKDGRHHLLWREKSLCTRDQTGSPDNYLISAPLAGVLPVPSLVSQNWMPLPAVVSWSHSGMVIALAASGCAASMPAREAHPLSRPGHILG